VNERLSRLERFFLGVGYLGDVPDFAYDAALSYGERLSSLVVTAALVAAGIDAVEVLPEDMGLVTDGEFGNAACDFDASEGKVREALSGGGVSVVPGFYGLSPEGKTTLFGRGGSDYSAAAIARCVAAGSLDVWKDVDGFLSADPGMVDRPVKISHLDYTEAAELSYFGAKILHPRTVEPLEDRGIPIRILNIDRLERGLEPFTVIDGRREVAEDVVKSVTHSDDIGVLRLSGPGLGFKHGILARTTARLDQRGINIKSVVTAQTCINLLVSAGDLEEAWRTARELHDSAVCEVERLSDISIIAVVGNCLFDRHGIAAKALSAVAEAGVHVLLASAGASNAAVYLITRKAELPRAVKAIHEAFFGG
jgi:bifunctional aspartokinase / homoserine dehydrogenase 1